MLITTRNTDAGAQKPFACTLLTMPTPFSVYMSTPQPLPPVGGKTTIGAVLSQLQPFLTKITANIDHRINPGTTSIHLTRTPPKVVKFDCPPLSLTKQLLDQEIVLTEDIKYSVHTLSRAGLPTSYRENETTSRIIIPMAKLFVDIFTSGLANADGEPRWAVQEHVPRENGGDLDVVFKRNDIMEPRAEGLCGHQMVVEMKSPRGCDDGVLKAFLVDQGAQSSKALLGQVCGLKLSCVGTSIDMRSS